MTAPNSAARSPSLASRVAWASIAVNVGLTALNLAIAAASGSLAVAAEMVHNLVDLVSSVAVLAGGILGGKIALKTKPKSLKTISGLFTIVAAILMLVNVLSGQ